MKTPSSAILAFPGTPRREYYMDKIQTLACLPTRVDTDLVLDTIDTSAAFTPTLSEAHPFAESDRVVFTMIEGKTVVLIGRLKVDEARKAGMTLIRATLLSKFAFRSARVGEAVEVIHTLTPPPPRWNTIPPEPRPAKTAYRGNTRAPKSKWPEDRR